MNNAELASQLKDFKHKLELTRQANQHNAELLERLKGAYQSKLAEILDEVEDAAMLLADSTDSDAQEAYEKLTVLLCKFRQG